MVRYHRHMDREQELDALLDGLDKAQTRALLRHPSWWYRCDCGHYGRPYDCAMFIIDDDSVHGWQLCQPRREWIQP